jgi:hypothetical protein
MASSDHHALHLRNLSHATHAASNNVMVSQSVLTVTAASFTVMGGGGNHSSISSENPDEGLTVPLRRARCMISSAGIGKHPYSVCSTAGSTP